MVLKCSFSQVILSMSNVQSAKEEVIVEIVDQCRILLRRVVQLINDISYDLLALWFLFVAFIWVLECIYNRWILAFHIFVSHLCCSWCCYLSIKTPSILGWHYIDFTCRDEELLWHGLSLHDDLQRALARYDAFLSGASLPEMPAESKQKALVEDPSVLSPK